MVKFIALALLVPIFFPFHDYTDEQDVSYNVEQDILKAVVGAVDVAGLYYLLNSKKWLTVMGDIHVKILSVALGWALAESITTNLLSII